MFPPRRILAATDFSDCSGVALNAAARLAAQCGAELVVLHALEPLLAEAARTTGFDLAGDTAAELERFVASSLPAPAARDRVRRLVIAGKADDVICQIAERESVDIIVVGAHGMSGIAHAVFGSTAERVLRQARVSVWVVPASWTAPDPLAADLRGTGPVIAAVDLKSGSAAAAAAASELARCLGTSLELLHVIAPVCVPGRWSDHAERAVQQLADRAEVELARLAAGLRQDVPTDLHVEIGNVSRRLTHAATPHGSCRPLLVLGRNPAESATSPGAVAYRVLLEAASPVLIYLPMD